MSLDHAYGAVLGAFVGDAAGAVLEFAPRPVLKAVGQLCPGRSYERC